MSMNFKTFHGGMPRPPTAAEVEQLDQLRENGLLDVYVEAQGAQDFWESLLIAVEGWMPRRERELWQEWDQEMRFAMGWPNFGMGGFSSFESIVRSGYADTVSISRNVTVGIRLSAVEHLLDVVPRHLTVGPDFAETVNERAAWFRVPIRLEGTRFSLIANEHLHLELVQPTFVLLSDPKLSDVDKLYRKAFDRLFSNDVAGAITAATSAVEEMLRLGGATGSDLQQLVKSGRNLGWYQAGPERYLAPLYAFRKDSDAHASGSDEQEVGMLVLHIAASLLHFLASTGRNDA